MKFSVKHFFSKCECVTFTEEILNGKLHFLPSDRLMIKTPYLLPRRTLTIHNMKSVQI